MANDDFRSYRGRDPNARGSTARKGASDPLAELARLIGQGDPYAEGGHEAFNPERSDRDATGSGVDWAAEESYADPRYDRPEDRHVAPPPPPAASYPPQERGYATEPPPSGRYFSGPAATFNGFHEDADADYGNEPAPVAPGRQLPAFMSAVPGEPYAAEEPEYGGGEAYAGEDYRDDAPRPRQRSGLIVVMAVLGLVVIGTASAFGYRYMFGGSMLPTLPPIIKANIGPNKIVPGSSGTQPNTPGQTKVASAGPAENLVSREEQPVKVEPPPAAPRVVSTIPITSGRSPAPAATPGPSPWPPAPAPVPGYPVPPSTSAASPAPTAAPPQPAAQAPAPASPEPKKVQTVTIRADQSGGSDAVPLPPQPPTPAPATRSPARAAKPRASVTATPPSGSNAPLSIIPGAGSDAPAPASVRARTAPTPERVASAEPVATVGASPPSRGGYAVQVTSQRTEAEAQASFQSLQAKFPNQLSGRQPIIRRADLGAKGTYYRALVGPFASAEAAAGLCSGLKAAGGNCIVQRN